MMDRSRSSVDPLPEAFVERVLVEVGAVRMQSVGVAFETEVTHTLEDITTRVRKDIHRIVYVNPALDVRRPRGARDSVRRNLRVARPEQRHFLEVRDLGSDCYKEIDDDIGS